MIPLLAARSITKSYAGVAALKSVSFELRSGEVHALVGENGAGKSTLIKALTGAVNPDEGEIQFDGAVIQNNSPEHSKRLGIAAIYQQPALFPDLTVSENIAINSETGGLWRRVSWKQRRAEATRLLEIVGARIHPDAQVSQLTMPEQQLVEIARALGLRARVLVLDEPTASLTDEETQKLFRVIRGLRDRGVGLVYISHRLEELFQIADRVTVLRDGAWISTQPMTGLDRGALIRMMAGRELAAVFPKRKVPVGDVVLDAQHVRSDAAGVRDVSVTLRRGEIVGMAGLVGSGRTQFAETLFGITPADGGTIRVKDEERRIASPMQAIALGIAYVPEDRRRHGLILEMPIAANITLATLADIFLRESAERRTSEFYREKLQLRTTSVQNAAGTLSGGNQQKVALARWLATKPAVLILDEPTQGVDVGAKAEIHRLMCDLAEQGMAILMISSELPEILAMSDRVVVMQGGAVAGVLDRADASQERILSLALGHREPDAA